MTRSQIRRRYVKIIGTKGGEHVVLFCVGHQSFRVISVETRREARWFAKQLVTALERLIRETQP